MKYWRRIRANTRERSGFNVPHMSMIARHTAVLLAAAVFYAGKAAAEVAATVLATSETNAVVAVRSVDRQTMSMEIEAPGGETLTFKVSPEANNFDHIEEGSRFCVRLLQWVGVSAGMPGDGLSLSSAWTAQFAEKGAKPGATVVNAQEIRAQVGATNS